MREVLTQILRVWLISVENSSNGFAILSLLNDFNLASVECFHANHSFVALHGPIAMSLRQW